MIERLDFQLLNGSITQSRYSHFLQDGNLPGVVELMLRDSVQHEIEIVSFAGNALAEARFRQRSNRLHKHIMRVRRLSNGLTPCGVGGFRNHWKIRRAGELNGLPVEPAGSGPSQAATCSKSSQMV